VALPLGGVAVGIVADGVIGVDGKAISDGKGCALEEFKTILAVTKAAAGTDVSSSLFISDGSTCVPISTSLSAH